MFFNCNEGFYQSFTKLERIEKENRVRLTRKKRKRNKKNLLLKSKSYYNYESNKDKSSCSAFRKYCKSPLNSMHVHSAPRII